MLFRSVSKEDCIAIIEAIDEAILEYAIGSTEEDDDESSWYYWHKECQRYNKTALLKVVHFDRDTRQYKMSDGTICMYHTDADEVSYLMDILTGEIREITGEFIDENGEIVIEVIK